MTTTSLPDLNRQLDDLEQRLPDLLTQYPDDGDFWMAFAGEAEVIEETAGVHASLVAERISAMLAKHGRHLASVDLP